MLLFWADDIHVHQQLPPLESIISAFQEHDKHMRLQQDWICWDTFGHVWFEETFYLFHFLILLIIIREVLASLALTLSF